MEKWLLRNIKIDYDAISEKLGVDKLLCKIMANRQMNSIKKMTEFLNPSLENLHDGKMMKDIEIGADIIIDSIKDGEKLRIVGDYDLDGNSAIVTLLKGLEKLNANIDYVIPHRIEDGYGINNRIVEEAINDGIDLIITCDNGISAFEPVDLAKKSGLKIIVTDHHEVPENLPLADAVINPKRKDCEYPFKELCGAGVVFKLIQVIYEKLGINIIESYELLEFVAMGTVGDVVDLIDENRIIVKEGLFRINNTSNIGLKALINATGLNGKLINTYSLGFIIGPCINASGRLETAEIAVELFMSKDINKANEYAKKLVNLNKQRKAMTEEGYKKIVSEIKNRDYLKDKVLVVYDESIHESIVGIIAGRIKEKYYKPTIVLTNSSKTGYVKGSGRSIEEYNMFENISKVKYLLDKFGGHPMAAGLSLSDKKIFEFRNKLNEYTNLSPEDLTPKVYIDAHLPIDNITFDIIESLKLLEPFGKANARPLFGERKVKIKKATILGENKNVLKLDLISKRGNLMEGIYFGDINLFKERFCKTYNKDEYDKILNGLENNIEIDIIFNPEINEFNNNRKIQLNIKSFRF